MEKVFIDQIALWLPLPTDELSVRVSPKGRAYYSKNGIATTAEQNIYRYAKNYKIGGKVKGTSYCLFVLTLESDADKVERCLDEAAKLITIDEANTMLKDADMRNFKWTNHYYEGGK